MKFFRDFRTFLMKGDIVRLSTAVIIGGAFGKIVTSFTNDILMPPIGLFLDDTEFTKLKVVLREAVIENDEVIKEAVSVNYGNFIQTVVNFIIIGFCIFLVLKTYESIKEKEKVIEQAKPKGPTQEELLIQIRDLLKK